jgi:hypothetical protein
MIDEDSLNAGAESGIAVKNKRLLTIIHERILVT